jgi:hypothetical protein
MSKFLSPLFCLFIFLQSCSNNPQVDNKLIYSTLNEIIQKDTVFARIVCSKFDQATIPYDIEQKFFKSDNSFIKEQLDKSLNAIIDTGQLYFYWKGKNRLEKSFIDTTCSLNIFYHLTYPIFSKDLQTVVVGIREDCNCMLGGWGFKAVYKRQNGKWKKIKEFDGWIS